MRVNWVLFQSFTFQNHQQWPRLLDCRKNVSIFKDKKLISFYRKSFENDSSTEKMCQMCKFFFYKKISTFLQSLKNQFLKHLWDLCGPFCSCSLARKGSDFQRYSMTPKHFISQEFLPKSFLLFGQALSFKTLKAMM